MIARRTTIRLDDELLSRARKHAAETGTTLTSLIEDSLRERLERRAGPARSIRLPTCGGGGVLPGVDLDHSAALVDVMDDTR